MPMTWTAYSGNPVPMIGPGACIRMSSLFDDDGTWKATVDDVDQVYAIQLDNFSLGVTRPVLTGFFFK